MTLSNALPVQFWLNGQESFNNKVVDGIEQVCFAQPFQCDDEINLQLKDIVDKDYSLKVLSTEGSELDNIPFSKTSEEVDYLQSYPLDTWENDAGAGITWTLGSNPAVVTTGFLQQSKLLIRPISGVPAGIYTLNYAINMSGADIIASLTFKKNGVSVGSKSLVDTDGVPTATSITLTDAPDQVAVSVSSLTVSTRTTTLYSLELIGGLYIYDVSFTFNDSGACDRQVKLQIVDEDASPAEVVAESDFLSIRETHLCTKLISYSNNSDFAGLVYEDSEPVFNLRIPAVFFEEETPTEQEDTELSNGEIVRLYNKLELKRRLDIGFVPQYMHQKMHLILMHDNITIDEKQWIRRDAYEKREGNRSYPLRRASVFLHDKQFIKENQL